jgi:hypothetical protein
MEVFIYLKPAKLKSGIALSSVKFFKVPLPPSRFSGQAFHSLESGLIDAIDVSKADLAIGGEVTTPTQRKWLMLTRR